MRITPEEITAILQAITVAIPEARHAYDRISANSNGTVRPLADIFAENDKMIADGIALADKEIGS